MFMGATVSVRKTISESTFTFSNCLKNKFNYSRIMFSTRPHIGNLFLKRQKHGNAELLSNCTEIRNRNPRNLERLRIARKPEGFWLDKPGKVYWHKLIVSTTNRYVNAEVRHFENGPVISASTSEWAFKKFLYRPKDISAYLNLGRVLAQRCLESGICEMYMEENPDMGQKMKVLVTELTNNGISLTEPLRYKHPHSWTIDRPEKTWESFE